MMFFLFTRARRGALLIGGALLVLSACQSKPDTAALDRLPYIGERQVVPRADGGPADTLYATIPAFTLTDQDSATITNDTFKNKVYVADFFFATCPSICPKMQSEMLRVYEKFKDNPRVLFLSHTIDPEHDSVAVLRDYAQRLGVQDASRWHFATASHDTIFSLARAYYVSAQKDASLAGGFAHSGAFTLIDSQRRIRGVYDGMNPDEVARLIEDLPVLLKEEAETTAQAAL
ncbi:electron transport protein SCO1/SenC [Hymenobacter roseosalivarius DSM 11622]|uniref:Electron transport protein SCO1/SenC n=1 Tax=Hymenobacter roseosalivarius DSM 11622 TaxID=645990 RepID=A0A1W1W1F6_9BACT|nr:SCO family protein [Hymenobacter roseosalivarius]SMB99320.1 electron transport protein SCO1/SenC [Hymenobacter roseosalivarius DSM 11622]